LKTSSFNKRPSKLTLAILAASEVSPTNKAYVALLAFSSTLVLLYSYTDLGLGLTHLILEIWLYLILLHYKIYSASLTNIKA
jgi:hypothetical protein